ncbi:hypothetical protein NQ317_008834 [Molorchus minor]|uniref:Uncharacterized protein n=1 Tax=Molorchus minor TaxID=1323400 RepID=A0ABQ9IYJ4_9CUCU|nr:hypothetical protein NQ317_008834 [Molorchus minor]
MELWKSMEKKMKRVITPREPLQLIHVVMLPDVLHSKASRMVMLSQKKLMGWKVILALDNDCIINVIQVILWLETRMQQCLDDGSWSPKLQPICELKEAPTTSAATGNGDFFSMTTSAADSTNMTNSMWASNGFGTVNNLAQPTTQAFNTANDLSGLFNTNEPSVFDPLSDQNKTAPVVPQPVTNQPQRPQPPSKILTGDLESSLTSLVENLTMDSASRSSQWNSPKNQPKTSTAGGWQPQPMTGTTAASYRPMAQPVMGQQPLMQPMMTGQPMMGQSMMQPMMGASMQYPMGAVQQPAMGSPKMGTIQPQQQVKQEVSFDPFGAL